MAPKNHDSNETPATSKPEHKHGTHFVENMFSGFGHETIPPSETPQPAAERPYHALRQSMAHSVANYRLPNQTTTPRVHGLSPALEVMTDLRRTGAVTIPLGASVDEANKAMIRHRVRSLFVVGEVNAIQGIITSTDIMGEKPIQLAQERGMRHVDILVHHVMTPAAQLEAIELREVEQARVGDIVETLKHSGRQHALVVDSGSVVPASAERIVCGIFSLTQIARQLGLAPQIGRVEKTFAEIIAAIAG
jgi:CBS domain-containing protein